MSKQRADAQARHEIPGGTVIGKFIVGSEDGAHVRGKCHCGVHCTYSRERVLRALASGIALMCLRCRGTGAGKRKRPKVERYLDRLAGTADRWRTKESA